MTKIRSSSAVCLSRRQWGLACFAFGAASFLGSSTACRGEDTKSISAPPATQSRSDQLAQATVRIVHGNGTGLGSGFHFVSPETIVTNAHVAKPLISGGAPLFAHAETGQRWALALIDSSPEEQFDFAILKASGASFDNRISLSPELSPIKSRGRRILYAGFPHGLEPLLVASSEVTAPSDGKIFVFGGMVHGGNSGGPIVDAETLLLIGIVTQRRFFGDPEMRRIDNEMKELQDGTAQWATHGSVQIMGIDFGAFAGEIAKIARVTNDLIRLNSTTGIGVGYPIIELTTRCREKGLL